MKDRTKQALAKALQDLLRTKTLEEVRVSELCARCDLQRQSFYYHFQDKYDLVAWIFLQDFTSAFSAHGNRLSPDCIAQILHAVSDKREMYLRILADRSQNLPLMYIKKYIEEQSVELLKQRDGVDDISPRSRVMVKCLVYGGIGITWEWMAGDINVSEDTLATWLCEMIPEELLVLE